MTSAREAKRVVSSRGVRAILWGGAGLVLLLMLAPIASDFIYAKTVGSRWAEWEAGIERHPNGVRVGCQAFTVGEGHVALLMVHGFGDGPPVFRKMSGAFAERGYTCRVLRLPGFAEPMDHYRRTDRAQWGATIQGELAALRKKHREVWVVGHSTGATLGVRQALDHPGSADGLILLAPLFAVSSERSIVMKPRSWFNLAEDKFVFTRFLENPFDLDVHDPAARDYPYRDRFVPVSVYRNLYDLVDEVKWRGGELTTPLLMFVSSEDQIVDPEASRQFFDEAASKPKEWIEMSDAGHVLPIDTGWERRVDKTDRFIRDHGTTEL